MPKKEFGRTLAEHVCRFHEGTDDRAWEWLGAHADNRGGQEGTRFRVWAPEARDVSVISESNGWLRDLGVMHRMDDDPSVWECFLPDVHRYDAYKYSICTAQGDIIEKADPFAFHAETRPHNASKVYGLERYEWHDRTWMRRAHPASEPMNIYEVHLGSWRMRDNCTFYSYREMADLLIPYVCDMGYTHLELLPLMEHPFDGSWGYQMLGWFAATSRYGTPYDLMYFIDRCHQAGLCVILDWSALGFPSDAHGLYRFDGTPCYECPPPGDRMPYGMRRFDFGKREVQSFLLSSAMFWITVFHADALRVSSVQPMLYLDYARADGDWTANCYGENLDLDSADFLRMLCDRVHACTGRRVISSSAGTWPSVTKPTELGGLGFSCMWRDEWVEQMLSHIVQPLEGQDFSDWLTLSLLDSTGERHVLALSHDVVAHGEGSLLARMPGQYSEKFAHLRTLYGFVMAHPGAKLLFMGGEFAQFTEWACHHGLDWSLLAYEPHRQMREYVRALNLFYRDNPPLWDCEETDSFVWVDRGEEQGILAFERRSTYGERLLCVINLTDAQQDDYAVHVGTDGMWEPVFTSDLISFGGAGVPCRAVGAADADGRLILTVPQHSVQFFSFVAQLE